MRFLRFLERFLTQFLEAFLEPDQKRWTRSEKVASNVFLVELRGFEPLTS